MLNCAKFKTLLILIAMNTVMFSCSTIPTKELNDAEMAIKESEKVEANKYALNELQNARDYLSTAKKQVDEKNNDKAKENAIKAKDMGDKAYFTALSEFVKSQNEGTKQAMDEAKASYADKLVPDKFQEAEGYYNEVQKDMEKLKVLSEKLKVQKAVKE